MPNKHSKQSLHAAQDVLAKHCGPLLDHFDLLMPYAELGVPRAFRAMYRCECICLSHPLCFYPMSCHVHPASEISAISCRSRSESSKLGPML